MTVPAWWDKERQDRNRRSKRQESKRAEQIGGRASSGSGSSWRSPQDVKAEGVLEQLKFTDKDSFTRKVKEWVEIRKDAMQAGRSPRMVIDFDQHGIRLVVTEERLS